MALFNNLWKLADAAEGYSLKKALASQTYLTETPKWTGSSCVQSKLNENPCSLCREVCPAGIYSENFRFRPPDYSACIHCGLCAAACPDRCIAPPVSQAEQVLNLSCKNGTALACKQYGGKLSCLAAVSWERMAALALEDGLILHTAQCEQCENPLLHQQVLDRIEKLRFFLGSAQFEEKVHFSAEAVIPAEPRAEKISRRDLFRSFTELPAGNTLPELPSLAKQQDSSLIFRAMLRDRIRSNASGLERGQSPRFRVILPVFTEDCYNCGNCAWKCPHKAIKLQEEEGSILVTVEVWRCTGCGICKAACKVNAVSGLGTMRVPHLGRTALKRIPAYYCEDCGHTRPRDAEEGVCAVCLGKRKLARIRAQREEEQAKASEIRK